MSTTNLHIENWGDMRDGIVDLYGEPYVTTTSYQLGDQFLLQYVSEQTSSEEQLREKEQESTQKKKLLDLIVELTEEYGTEIYKRNLKAMLGGKSVTEMAEEFKCSPSAVYQSFYGKDGRGGLVNKIRKVVKEHLDEIEGKL